MLKYLNNIAFVLLTALCLALPPATHAAGTLPIAMAQQMDANGQPVVCQVNFFVAGTVATRQNAFADFGLTQPLPNPLSCDQTGRVPMFWLADGLIHVQMLDASGLSLIDTTMQVLGPSSGGGGGGGTVDPTTIASTGDMKFKYATGSISGWVRLNGLTIGNTTSGATERANADTQNLFVFLYNQDGTLVVSGGRSGNALNDFNANKQLTLPDWRGRAPVALADMGNSASSVLTAAYAGCIAGGPTTQLGIPCGNQNHTQIATELPSSIPYTDPGHSHPITDPGHTHTISDPNQMLGLSQNHSGSFTFASSGSFADSPLIFNSGVVQSATTGISINAATTHITINPSGGNPFTVVQPIMLATFYIKL